MDPPVPATLLDAIARTIDVYLAQGKRVVVHCGEGVERAPLAVAWWLHRRQGLSLDEAYQVVRNARPQACDRQEWIVLP
jgi:histidinol-phosphate aminotransferase